MFALSAKSTSSLTLQRGARSVARSAVPAPIQRRIVRVRAETESTPSSKSTEETIQKLQTQATEALKFVQEKWEATDNAEKPAAIAIIVGVVIAQIAIGATVDAIDRIPVINKGLQLIGLAVTSLFLYRYTTEPAERESVKKSLEGFVKSVTGDK